MLSLSDTMKFGARRFRKPGGLWWSWREDSSLPGSEGLYAEIPANNGEDKKTTYLQVFLHKEDVARNDYEVECEHKSPVDLPRPERAKLCMELFKSLLEESK